MGAAGEPLGAVRWWVPSTVVWQHRTIEDYVRLVTDHGFRLDVLSECEPSAELLAADTDELARRRRVPLMLLVGATRRQPVRSDFGEASSVRDRLGPETR